MCYDCLRFHVYFLLIFQWVCNDCSMIFQCFVNDCWWFSLIVFDCPMIAQWPFLNDFRWFSWLLINFFNFLQFVHDCSMTFMWLFNEFQWCSWLVMFSFDFSSWWPCQACKTYFWSYIQMRSLSGHWKYRNNKSNHKTIQLISKT